MTNYDVTIGYKAVISVSVKADSEEEAKEKALKHFRDTQKYGRNILISDDNYSAEGVLNMDTTWNMVQN